MKRLFLPIIFATLISAVAAQTPPPDPTPTPQPGCYQDLMAMRDAGGKHVYRISNKLRLLLKRDDAGEWTMNVWYSIEPVAGGEVRGAVRRCSIQIPVSDAFALKANNFASGLRKKQIEAEGEKDDDNDGEADD